MWTQVRLRHALSLHLVNLRSFSMGGLLAADALIEFVRARPDSTAPLWPNIVACIAFDTPVCPPLDCDFPDLLMHATSTSACTQLSSRTVQPNSHRTPSPLVLPSQPSSPTPPKR